MTGVVDIDVVAGLTDPEGLAGRVPSRVPGEGATAVLAAWLPVSEYGCSAAMVRHRRHPGPA